MKIASVVTLWVTVDCGRNPALKLKEFRDRSFSPSGGMSAQSDKVTDSSRAFELAGSGKNKSRLAAYEPSFSPQSLMSLCDTAKHEDRRFYTERHKL
jgi:hypothetical protein